MHLLNPLLNMFFYISFIPTYAQCVFEDQPFDIDDNLVTISDKVLARFD